MEIFNNPGNIDKGAGFAGDTGKTYGNNRFSVFEKYIYENLNYLNFIYILYLIKDFY